MIVDFRDAGVGAEHSADVCVVGAGPAGLAVTQQLRGSGRSVLLVESGGLDPDPDTSSLNQGRSVGLEVDLLRGRARVFGGTGTVWPGQCLRLDPSDLEPRDWVPDSGWPFTAATLERYYERAEAWLGIPPDASDERAWRRYGLAAPDFDPRRLTHKSAVYSPQPDVGARLREEFARADDVTVLLHATAARIDRGAVPVAESLEIRSLSGRVGRVRARTFVLCGGGIENARLLLLSGVADDCAPVGRYFQEHPTIWADVVLHRPAAVQEFYNILGRRAIRYVPKIALSWETQRRERVLNAVATMIYDRTETPGMVAARALSGALQERRRPENIGRAELHGALREARGVAAAGYRRFVKGRPSAATLDRTRLKILVEQAPNPESRVYLSSESDALGLPTACVDWRLTELERRTAKVFTEALGDELSRTGLGHVAGTDWLDDGGWTSGFEDAYHPMGTTRMSSDRAKGVVDADCRLHGVANVYVCGSSVFPTGGYANPTLTIVALALRLADHLKATTTWM